MGFVVEDGTGKSDATAYVTVAELKTYWSDRGVTISDADATVEDWIVLATEYVDRNYEYYGDELYDDQGLRFPRTAFYDCRGREVESGTIPQSLKDAVSYFGYKSNGSTLDVDISSGVKSKSVGSVSITYSNDSSSAKTVYSTADKLMRCIAKAIGNTVTRC